MDYPQSDSFGFAGINSGNELKEISQGGLNRWAVTDDGNPSVPEKT
jgi:hypothetical protein